ncbi:MAG: ADOP family duplicated permease [Longimicrobiales bacterium]
MPPRWLERLAFFPGGPRGELLFVLGDLREEYANRRRDTGAVRAHLWFLVEAVSARARLLSVRPRTTAPKSSAALAPRYPIGLMTNDIARSLKTVARRPRFAILVAVTMATGVAATVVMMAAFQSVVLTPLPWSDPDRVYMIETKLGDLDWSDASSIPEFRDLDEGVTSFEEFGGYGFGVAMVGDSMTASRLPSLLVTGELFALLGAQPALGRSFVAEDALPGADPVVLLSDQVWRREFAADPGLVGRTVQLNGRATVVVGIMPPDFAFPDRSIEVWTPWRLDLANPNASRSLHFLRVVGRLGSQVDPNVARAELAAVTATMAETHADAYFKGYQTRMRPYLDVVLGGARNPLRLLGLAAALLLAIATVNVSMLVADRRVARGRETGLRVALGSGYGRALLPLAVESWAGIVVGAGIGTLVGWSVLRWAREAAPAGLPRIDLLGISPGTLTAVGVSLAIVGTVATLLAFAGSGVPASIRPGTRGARGDRSVFRRSDALVVTQIALAMTLTSGAGLMVRTLHSLYEVDPGIRPEGVLTARITPRGDAYRSAEARIEFHRQLRAELTALPGVTEVGVALNLPYDGRYGSDWVFQNESTQHLGVGESPVATVQMAGPGYFEAAGIPLEGRGFTEGDRADGRLVAVVNRTMAERFWPGRSAVGQRLRVWNDPVSPWMEIVGVAADIRSFGLDRDAPPIYYVPTTQSHVSTFFVPGEVFVLVRTSREAEDMALGLRRATGRVDPTATLSAIRPFEEVVAAGFGQRELTLWVLSAFGGVALLLAGIGVLASMLTLVTKRRAEIGVRRALGETAGSVAGRLLRRTLGLTLAGCAMGVVLSVGAARLIVTVLYGVPVWDPPALLGAATVLLSVALLATLVPAMSALRVEPLEALRAEG